MPLCNHTPFLSSNQTSDLFPITILEFPINGLIVAYAHFHLAFFHLAQCFLNSSILLHVLVIWSFMLHSFV